MLKHDYSKFCERYRNEYSDTVVKSIITKMNLLKLSKAVNFDMRIARGKVFLERFDANETEAIVPEWVFGFYGSNIWPAYIRSITFKAPIVHLKQYALDEAYLEDDELYMNEIGLFNGIKSKELTIVGLNPRFLQLSRFFIKSEVEKVTFVNFNTKGLMLKDALFVSCHNLREVHFGDGFTLGQAQRAVTRLFADCPNLEIVDFGPRQRFSSMYTIEEFCNRHKSVREVWLVKPLGTPINYHIPNVSLKFYN